MTEGFSFKFIIILGWIFSSRLLLASEGINTYYSNVFMGEKKTNNYIGPLDPRSIYSDRTGNLVLLDDIFKDQYLNREIEAEPFSLYRFWFNDLVEESVCPNSVLSDNIDYIRYLYRLVSISYLFEGLRLNNQLARKFNDNNICSITYKNLFHSCKPKSSDMKKFHERVYGKFVNEIDKVKHQPLSKSEVANWISDFHKSNSLTNNPIYARLHDWCFLNQKNCRELKVPEVLEILSQSCAADTETLNLLCSEKDNFYGLSSISIASELIKKSNAFNLINQTGMGEDCLRRYAKLFSAKETNYQGLQKIYPIIYSHLIENKSRYLQGELFLPGALKEFDMKGLSDFLTALKPPKPEVVIVKRKPQPKPVIKPVEAPKIEEKPVVVAKEPEVAPEPPKPLLSEFEQGVLDLSEKNLDSVAIDMDRFRDGFEFSPEMIVQLSTPIKRFQTRSALTDMKSYDKLGTKEAPVGLIFLKFLIDTENHQGLYNITNVLGDKFYVNNDLEKKLEGHLIELKNDSSTKNRWQIILVKSIKK